MEYFSHLNRLLSVAGRRPKTESRLPRRCDSTPLLRSQPERLSCTHTGCPRLRGALHPGVENGIRTRVRRIISSFALPTELSRGDVQDSNLRFRLPGSMLYL